MNLSHFSMPIVMVVFALSIALLIPLMWLLTALQRRKKRFSPFTEHRLRLPGHSLRKEREKILDDFMSSVIGFTISIGLVLVGVVFVGGSSGLGVAIAGAAGLVWWAVTLGRLFGKVQPISLGLEGEEYTGQELSFLMRKEAFVFHDIPYKYGNIDHIVIGNGTVFAVETKTYRKPKSADSESGREATVVYNGTALKFPHFTTDKPLQQAERHAKYVAAAIRDFCGFDFPVKGVVALPGWFIDSSGAKGARVLAVNPKRGRSLSNWLGQTQDKVQRDAVIRYIESVARSVPSGSQRFDPDWKKHYDFWSEPKYREPVLGER